MSINEIKEKVKPFYGLMLTILVAVIFFGLGRLSAIEDKHLPIKIENPTGQTASVSNSQDISLSDSGSATSSVSVMGLGGEIIGSKNSKKYYFPWCGTVKMMKPENQIKFNSIQDARDAGFSPGGNCKGLK